MLPRLWLLVGSDRPTMSLIVLSWTAKKWILIKCDIFSYCLTTMTHRWALREWAKHRTGSREVSKTKNGFFTVRLTWLGEGGSPEPTYFGNSICSNWILGPCFNRNWCQKMSFSIICLHPLELGRFANSATWVKMIKVRNQNFYFL